MRMSSLHLGTVLKRMIWFSFNKDACPGDAPPLFCIRKVKKVALSHKSFVPLNPMMYYLSPFPADWVP